MDPLILTNKQWHEIWNFINWNTTVDQIKEYSSNTKIPLNFRGYKFPHNRISEINIATLCLLSSNYALFKYFVRKYPVIYKTIWWFNIYGKDILPRVINYIDPRALSSGGYSLSDYTKTGQNKIHNMLIKRRIHYLTNMELKTRPIFIYL